ncbi:MAG: plasmid pRiA4b ORF-3 family protein [Candidatus Acetothermia bacterium]|jgi:hypothetical protein|nr:plasmid pRiA4b ORF-3 family protein [Candidatus Acetothermia bacterium]MDH7505338.1 hypothetical protein [Candidatus Acetothermia bacterium]
MATREVCELKVILSDWDARIRGRPYRLLAVPGELTLHDLAELIVSAFDFDLDHCFGFYDNYKSWIHSTECYDIFKDIEEEEGVWLEPSRCGSVIKTKISDIFTPAKKRWLFLFDYGDEWHFIVDLMGVTRPEKGERYPRILESVGEAPPQYECYDEEEEMGEGP